MLIPVGKKLMVEVITEERKSGLILPTEDKKGKRIEYGKVVAAGKACGVDFELDMIVYFDHFAGTGVKIDGQEYLMLKEEDICAIRNQYRTKYCPIYLRIVFT